MSSYIVVGYKWWCRYAFDHAISKLDGKWFFAESPISLGQFNLKQIKPRYLFFLHWSWKIPKDLYGEYECVAFHMTDLPFGRGGSPLQNLIARGIKETMLTAFKVNDGMDTGDVYLKLPLSIARGSAEEIYLESNLKATEMIKRIIKENIKPMPQKGDAVLFKRRKPEQSIMPSEYDKLYDHIRMLDAEGYPKAFLKCGDYRIEFNNVRLGKDELYAGVTIKVVDD